MSETFEFQCEWSKRPSPYYNDSHHQFRDKIHHFVQKEILPFINKWEEQKAYPASLRQRAYQAGIYGALWPSDVDGTPPESFDEFHSLIWHEELARAGSGGLMASCFLPPGWGLLPVMKHHLQIGTHFDIDGSVTKQERQICKEVIRGTKTIALAVTEPSAGSDVSNIKCRAIEDPSDPDSILISGEKYFISNAINADYLTVAVNLDFPMNNKDNDNKNKNKNQQRKKTSKQMSFVLLDVSSNGEETRKPRKMKEGVFMSRMNTQGWLLGGTTYVTFRDFKVHKSMIIGEMGKGFVPILSNFNHGRFAMFTTANMYARVCCEDAIEYAQKRHTFGQPLIKHQVIRHKISEMMRKIEAAHALIEHLTYLSKCYHSRSDKDRILAGPFAMCKIENAKVFEYCAREASQIFGGRSYIRGGVASRVERLYREVTVMGIAEGATEVLSDFVVRQAKL